jgi:hypothetical protein
MDTKKTWNQLYSCYQDNCKHTIAFIIGELSQNTLADEKLLEPQLITLLQKFYILASLSVKLSESLVAKALTLSLTPS